MLQWTRGCRYFFNIVILFLLDIYVEVGLLDHMVVLFLNSWETSILSVPIYIPINHALGFPFLHIINPQQHLILVAFLRIVILTGVRRYFIVALICIFLMIRDVEHLFMYLLAIWISCFIKKSVQVLCPYFNWIIWFLLLSYIWIPSIIWILNPY